MKWLEVIHLRSATQKSDLLNAFLDQIVQDIGKEEGALKINLFKRVNLESDVCLQLYHESEQVKLIGSRLGMHLAEALKRFGMVNHTVWVTNKYETSR
jgi:hypothetical protein